MALLGAWLCVGLPAHAEGCRQGLRQQSVISDFALGRAWTVYASCAHPETPRIAIMVDQETAQAPSRAVGAATTGPASDLPAVRMGSKVRLWLSSPVARIALSAVALENGAAGATIRVRATPGGKVLYGTVRAPDSVELVAAGFSGVGQ